MVRLWAILLLAVSLAVMASGTRAETALTVFTGEGTAATTELTLDDLAALDQVEVRTLNDFLDKMAVFRGPLLRTVLAGTDLEAGDEIEVTAMDDYSTRIPAQEVLDYDVILALSINGEPLTEHPEGPIWVIYPMSDHPELQDESFNARLIWQLKTVRVVPAE